MDTPEVMRSYVDAMRKQDFDAAFAHYSDDIVAHVPGRSPLSGVKVGKPAVVEFVRAAIARASEHLELEALDMLVGQEHVGLLVREQFTAGGRTLDVRRLNVYRVRGDRISEIWIFENDQYAVDEFFGG